MAGLSVTKDQLDALYESAQREKKGRKHYADAIVDLCIERSVLRAAVRGLLSVVDTTDESAGPVAAALVALNWSEIEMPSPRKISRANSRSKPTAGPVTRDPRPDEWVCAKCGSPGGVPDGMYTSIDPRYRMGSCPAACRGTVSLILGSAFDRDVWEVRAKVLAEQALFEKLLRGAPMTEEERAAAVAIRDRKMSQVLAFDE